MVRLGATLASLHPAIQKGGTDPNRWRPDRDARAERIGTMYAETLAGLGLAGIDGSQRPCRSSAFRLY